MASKRSSADAVNNEAGQRVLRARVAVGTRSHYNTMNAHLLKRKHSRVPFKREFDTFAAACGRDALVVKFGRTKNDKDGANSFPRHVYANPHDPAICTILKFEV
ncbi:hypothetical protein H257_08232 [Aphanomyces astaci]|uniref:Uncharacterized protein n=1 Tax=Aphanomyces astaci TaxID=112090 RepID=W4GEB5_APHAT|nr:hypothetical protein H257_08232 [Aphanomyces astaci]ETV78015.1 hypothetical protein H257_08232 [Aphanomyces astaci]|eukprot:XP_009832352.1 hypothetical protein H257_08232 [Aphanomyces astaci]